MLLKLYHAVIQIFRYFRSFSGLCPNCAMGTLKCIIDNTLLSINTNHLMHSVYAQLRGKAHSLNTFDFCRILKYSGIFIFKEPITIINKITCPAKIKHTTLVRTLIQIMCLTQQEIKNKCNVHTSLHNPRKYALTQYSLLTYY